MQACEEVQGCQLLVAILKTALLVGNFLNAGNARTGDALGFQIDALLKLKDVRSTRARWVALGWGGVGATLLSLALPLVRLIRC